MGMQGYLIDTRAGAVADIFFHHKGIALSLAAAGCCCHNGGCNWRAPVCPCIIP